MRTFLVVFLVYCALSVLAQSAVRNVLSQCAEIPLASNPTQLCVNVTSKDCFELEGRVTMSGSTLWGPRQVSIPKLVELAQSQLAKSQATVCEAIDIVPGTKCSICNTIDKLKIDGDDLRYCGKLLFNCSFPVPISREIPLPCVNITDCKLFGCQNNCNGGTCSNLGLCQCKPGYYGPDCSIFVKDNCIESKWWSKTCWNAEFPDCQTLKFSVGPTDKAATVTTHKIAELKELTLVPCQTLAQERACQICASADNVHPNGSSLIGCPKIKLTCGGVEVNNYQLTCLPLVTSDTLGRCVSPNSGPPSDINDPARNDTGGWSTSKLILMLLVVVLGIGILGVGAYFAVTRYKQWKQGQTFQRVSAGNVQDGFETLPLGGDEPANESSLEDE